LLSAKRVALTAILRLDPKGLAQLCIGVGFSAPGQAGAELPYPEETDKDPEWRAAATYTTGEVEKLISDPRILADRRVLYALKALAGLRHGEAAALRWRHYDATLEPLGRLLVAVAYNSRDGIEKGTKTDITRRVPVHPTLSKVLAAWRLSGWHATYGRAPDPDDLIVPARTFQPRDKKDAQDALVLDLAALGLRVEAGKDRNRGGHHLRSWFVTTCQEHGAHRDLLRVVTHTASGDVVSGYTRASWPALCAEVGKLRVSVLDGKVFDFGTVLGTADKRARNRWLKSVTPPGLEGGIRDTSGSPGITISDGNAHERALPDDTKIWEAVPRGAQSIADAIRAGDMVRALELAEALVRMVADKTQ